MAASVSFILLEDRIRGRKENRLISIKVHTISQLDRVSAPRVLRNRMASEQK